MAKDDVKKTSVPAAAAGGPDPADIADPGSAGPATRFDESMLRFLIELAVNPEFRTKFSVSPGAAINDVSPDMSDSEKKAILERNSAKILEIMKAIPLQNSVTGRVTQSTSRSSGGKGRPRLVRVEIEFED